MATVTVLGTGLMGAGMARSLLRAGFDVRVWNRTAAKASPLEQDGASVHESVSTAVAGADVVLTMLFDADAVASVQEEMLSTMADDAVWGQASTVGPDAAARFGTAAEEHGVGFVDAPVLGTRRPAEEGTLVVLAAGLRQLREVVQPVFDAIGSRTIWVSERPGDGHRLKLVANSWVLSLVGATAQAVALARGEGLDPRLFLDAISGGASDCAYAHMKAAAMIDGDFAPSFPLRGAVKDAALIRDALVACGVDDSMMAALYGRFSAAAAAGYADEDMAVVVRALADGAT